MDWIYVRGPLESVKAAINAYCDIAVAQNPETFKVHISTHPPNKCLIWFDPRIPTYAFANLIGWLNRPSTNTDLLKANAYLTSPSSHVRYMLFPHGSNSLGDTLVGSRQDGNSISIFLPKMKVCECSRELPYVDDSWALAELVSPNVSFKITLDTDKSFENPNFEITHEMDFDWAKLRGRADD